MAKYASMCCGVPLVRKGCTWVCHFSLLMCETCHCWDWLVAALFVRVCRVTCRCCSCCRLCALLKYCIVCIGRVRGGVVFCKAGGVMCRLEVSNAGGRLEWPVGLSECTMCR